MSQTLLVTGAAGHLGQRVIANLITTHKIPASRIVATTRDPGKLAALTAQGVKVRKADFEDPASLATALAGVDRMLLISTDALDRPGRRLAQHQAAIEAAKKAGVQHIAYTSMPNPDDSLVSFAPDHWGTEQALLASGLAWTILRNSWYMENLFMSLPNTLATGKWFTATGNGRIAHISREDCARAAAAALASESTPNARYDIAGSQAHTTAEIAALASAVFGKPVEVVQVTDDELAQGLQAAGVPAGFIPMLVSFDANTRAGKFDIRSNAVEKLTGKAPQALRDFLIANKTAAVASHERT
jgi:NAD(P)H dehydrogenase (quinone)